MLYSDDVLAPGWRTAGKPTSAPVEVARGMVLEDPTSGFCGAVVRWENGLVVLEDRAGARKSFEFGPGFWLDGKPVDLRPPRGLAPKRPTHTASGSRVGEVEAAKVALPSRIYVEGRHDAELVEKIWGDDHLVPGSKESRIVAGIRSEHVLVTGHPYIDIWQAVRPERVGLDAWPAVPRDLEWKVGASRALGRPANHQAEIAATWAWILGRVRDWRDLDAALPREVERLIDFVTGG